MIKIKHLGLLAIASSTFLFSGCIYVDDSMPVRDRYYDDRPRANISLVSYSYPYYYNRPFYYLDGQYYYGGSFRNGFYHYGNRRFRHGHYYSRGYRYHNGRRYRAKNRQHGYFRDRDSYRHSDYYRNRDRDTVRRVDRGREYRSREYHGKDDYFKNSWDNKLKRKQRETNNIIRNRANQNVSQHTSVRQRPSR